MKNVNLIDKNYLWKYWVDWTATRGDTMSQPQKCTFREKGKKRKNNTFLISGYHYK